MIAGRSTGRCIRNNEVGKESRDEVLPGEFMIICFTSPIVACSKEVSEMPLCGAAGSFGYERRTVGCLAINARLRLLGFERKNSLNFSAKSDDD